MFDPNSIEREIYDQLMLDRSIRAKFDPQELEDFIVRIAEPFKDALAIKDKDLEILEDYLEDLNLKLTVVALKALV